MSKRQHHKGKKRPRSWHRSKTSGKHFYRRLSAMEKAFRRAARDIGETE